MASLTDHLLTVDSYKRPKVITDHEAAYTLIIRLLLMNPGTDQLHPLMGIGIAKNYRYSEADSIQKLRNDLKNQIQTYLPSLYGADVSIDTYGTTLEIYINTEDVTFGIAYDSESGKVGPLTLDELKR